MKTGVLTNAVPIARKAKRASVDWPAVERDYRAGILSLREMAAIHSVSHVSIKKHADKNGWTRDLQAKIKARADELVNRSLTTTELTAQAKVTEIQQINSNALAIANVRLGHRQDITRARALTSSLFAELEAQCKDPDLLERFAELMRSPDDKGMDKANDLLLKIISLPGRTDTMKKLAETLKMMIGLEREAWGLDAVPEDQPKTSMGAWLEQMQTRRSALPIVHQVERDDAL